MRLQLHLAEELVEKKRVGEEEEMITGEIQDILVKMMVLGAEALDEVEILEVEDEEETRMV